MKPSSIHIVLICYALDILPLVESIDGPDVTWHIYSHSRKPVVVEAYQQLQGRANVLFHDYGTNRGLSVSWNDGLIEAQSMNADAILVINDDITMTRADLDLMAEACVNHRDCGIIVAEGFNQRMNEWQILQYAIFGINPVALEVVGYFDQNLIPYTYEDSDHARRCALCGIQFYNAGATSIVHVGSATVGTVTELNEQYRRTAPATAAYYTAKWGGLPGFETYNLPFNNTSFGYQIAASQRHDPYPGYSRDDLEMIKL